MHSYRIGNPNDPVTPGTPHGLWFDYLGLQSSAHGPQTPISIHYTDKESPIAKGSTDWTTINEEHYNSVYRYGFEYLNSSACATMMARLSEIEEKTIIGTRDAELIRGLERWRDAIQRREREMIGNIYEYCRENVFDTGVFLVGAAHKTAIVKEIEKHASTKAVLVNWNFAYDGRIP